MEDAKLPRSRQKQKSHDTKRRICEATIDALANFGYERVSTKLIAEQGRMSRGAINHHFPTKNDILVAAYDHIQAEWEEGWPFLTAEKTDNFSTDELIDSLWANIFSQSTYLAVLELMLAARLDFDLKARLKSSIKGWSRIRDERTAILLGLCTNDDNIINLLHLNLCMLRGIAVNQFFAEMPNSEKPLIDTWKHLVKKELLTRLRNTPNSSKSTRAEG